MHSRGYGASNPQRNVMFQSVMSPLVSMLLRTFLNTLKFLMAIFKILVYIYPSQSTCDTSIVQLLPVLRWRIRQLRVPLRQNSQQICMHKHFNALGCNYIFAGIVYCSVGGLHGSCQSAISAYVILTHVAKTPFTALSGGRHI